MTQEEQKAAVDKLISESNRESERVRAEFEEKKRRVYYRCAENRTLNSTVLEQTVAALQSRYDRQMEQIQQELDESLKALYAETNPDGKPGEGVQPETAPYPVDYSLPMRDRYVVVKNYYTSYQDPARALADFQADPVAKDYLGSYYDYLLQLLLLMQEEKK